MLDVVRLEEAFAARTEYLGWAIRIGICRFPIRNGRLLLAKHSRTVSDVTFEYFDFHFFHTLRCLDVPLMEDHEDLDGRQPHLLLDVYFLLLML